MLDLKREGIFGACNRVYLVSLDETKYDLERLGSFLENREMEEPWSMSEMACGYREIAYSIGT